MLFDSAEKVSRPTDLSSMPLVTLSLIAINVVVFLAMVVSGDSLSGPSSSEMLRWGANFGPLTASGQWWRLLTACFLHFGFIHVGMNMFILFQVGPLTERLFGRTSYLLLYIVAGVGGNVLGLFFHPNAVGAGASGAIFGVYGGLLAFLLFQRGVVPSAAAINVAKSCLLFIGYNVIYGLASPETDLVAHAGGLVTGFAAGSLLAQPIPSVRSPRRHVRVLSVGVGALLLIWVALAHVPRSSESQREWYRQVMTGPRVTVGAKDELVYGGSATKQDAQSVAQMLLRVGLFKNPGVTMLLEKTSGSTSLSIPLRGFEAPLSRLDRFETLLFDGKKAAAHYGQHPATLPWTDPAVLGEIRALGPFLASAAGGLPFTVRLLNGVGELKAEIPVKATSVFVGARDRISYSGQATAPDAMALGNALRSCGAFRDTGSFVLLRKDSAGTQISFFVNDPSNDAGTVAYLQTVGRKVAPSVGGLPLNLHLIDLGRKTSTDFTIR